MLYHYTDRDSARAAVADGVLRASPMLVYRDLSGPMIGAMPSALEPVVWFTASEDPSPTVIVRAALSGIPIDRPGAIWRFGVDGDAAPEDLRQWAIARGYPAELFRWMLATAGVAGEDSTDWRLSSVDVPRSGWRSVQSLHGDRWLDE